MSRQRSVLPLLPRLGGANPRRHNSNWCDGEVQQPYTEPGTGGGWGGGRGAAPARSTSAANPPQLPRIYTSAFAHSRDEAAALIN